MNSKILLFFVLAIITFAQPHPRIGRNQGKISGAYHTVESMELEQMKKAGPFQEVERATRMFYQAKTGNQLGGIISIERQVVSGMNYKITFAASADSTTEKVVMTVFYQPWTKTIEITNISPPIDGVTDENGRLLPDQTQQN